MPDSTEEIQTENVDPIELRLGIAQGEVETLKARVETLEHLLKVKQLQLDEMSEACLKQCELLDQLREKFAIVSDDYDLVS